MKRMGSAKGISKALSVLLLCLSGALEAQTLPTWRMAVEKNGVTNWVTTADARGAIDVSFAERDGKWCGTLVNREKGAVVLAFEVMSAPQPVEDGCTALYLPYVYGWRIRRWPRPGVELPGRKVWEEATAGVFVLANALKYPGKFGTMQWCTLTDGTDGFYLGSEDPTCGAKDFRVTYDSKAKTARLGFELPMFVPEGVSYEIPPLVFANYRGGWKDAARRYRAWWDTCRKVVRRPDAIRDMVGCVMVILKQQNGEFVWPYTDFASLGDAAIAHGLYNIEMHGWGIGGHDRLYPEYDPDPGMGGREALQKGVADLRRRGLHVTVYSNGQLQQHGGTRWFAERGDSCAIRLRDGSPLQEYWVKYNHVKGVHFDVACPACPLWREQMLKICRDGATLGFDGFFYDQIGKQWPWPCFDARHGHRPGQYVWQEDRRTLFEHVLSEMQKEKSDFVLWSEAFNDTLLTSVAAYQGLDYVRANWCVENRFVPNIGCEMYPELTAYTFPELVTTDRVFDPFCTRARANGCAVTNLRIDFEVRYPGDRLYVENGTPPDPCEYARVVSRPSGVEHMAKDGMWRVERDYLKCVNDFRLRHRDMLLRGTFRADEGFAVAGGDAIVANRWTAEGGEEGILVWNAGDAPAAVRVEFGQPLVGCCEPERGDIAPGEPLAANTLRLYRYGNASCKQ